MKINPIGRVFSAVKTKASQSRIAQAYQLYKYNEGNLAGPSIFDSLGNMSLRRAVIKIFSRVS